MLGDRVGANPGSGGRPLDEKTVSPGDIIVLELNGSVSVYYGKTYAGDIVDAPKDLSTKDGSFKQFAENWAFARKFRLIRQPDMPHCYELDVVQG